ncbi:MAG: hypothetical protein AAGF12_15345 [Myxococcota bacterium]
MRPTLQAPLRAIFIATHGLRASHGLRTAVLRTTAPVAASLLAMLLTACPPRGQEQPIYAEPPAEEVDNPEGSPEPAPQEPVAEETSGGGDNLVVGEDACESDSDCVPAACCHAAACVAAANAPSCDDMMCTQECRAGTIDCGGGCLCHEGRCAARLMEPQNL